MATAISARTAIGWGVRVSVLALCLSPAGARAGGFATARFGGEHGTAADVLPSALYYNPGAIGLLDGHQLMVEADLALRTAEYERDAGAIDPSTLELVESAGLDRDDAIDALSGEGSLSNWVLAPFVGFVTDLGMPKSPLRLGAAFFVPFGGQSNWDEEDENETFPGASDGPARWYSTEGTLRSLTATLGAAYRIDPLRLSLGVSGNLYFNQVHTVRARNANATDNLVAANGTLIEGRSLLDVSNTAFGLGLGALWEPIAEKLWVGASYQSQPAFGNMELEGELENTLGAANPAEPADVVLTEELPDIFRFAGRVRPLPVFELRLELRWERWSQLEQMCLANADADIDAACETRRDGSQVNPEFASDVVQIFDRDWHDTVNVRASGSYFLLDSALELLAGVGFETSAIPDRTLDPALYDMEKMWIAVGAGYRLGIVRLTLTFTDVIYFERDTRGVEANEALELPSRQPSNAGVFSQNAFIIQPAAEFSF